MEARIKELFLAYLEKEISKDDEKKLVAWIKDHPDSVNELKDFMRIWNWSDMSGQLNNELLEERWNLFIKKTQPERTVNKKQKKSFIYWSSRIAAIFILGAVLSFSATYLYFNSSDKNLAYNEIKTPDGSNSNIVLPDGSEILLNAGSSIRYSNLFNKKQREVFLSGEAYFKVVSNKSKVFVVNASDLTIKAYGTAFNVKTYPEENTVEATLIEGSIGVKRTGLNNKQDELILEPNQRVVYYRSANKSPEIKTDEEKNNEEVQSVQNETSQSTYLISKGIDPRQFTSWKDGILVIKSETLDDLAVTLERKYNVKIHFDNETLRKLKFTGSLQNETVEQVMEAISIAAKIEYEINDRDIWLKDITESK